MTPSDWELLHGVDAPPTEARRLLAGPVEAMLIDGDLRYVRRGRTEIARRIQVAVRSEDWGTVSGLRSNEEVAQSDDGFRVRFESLHRHGDLEFRWEGTIEGSPEGVITYTMDGVAERDFTYRRIGLCVLHPTDVFAGAPFEASASGERTSGTLPASVGPQRFDGDIFPPLFDAFDRITMVSRDGVQVQFAFDGDIFEMEDQRNWTDASFKSYCQNPQTRAAAWAMRKGTSLRQRVTLSSSGGGTASTGRRTALADGAITVTLSDDVIGSVPALGVSAGPVVPSERQLDQLRALGLEHLRVDLNLDSDLWRSELQRAAALARSLGCALELAVFTSRPDALEDLVIEAPLARCLVFGDDGLTPVELVTRARSALGGVAVGGGSNVYFAELNRAESFPTTFDVLSYPITPQVHSDDDVSLVETPLAQADTVRRARSLAGHAAIAVTPITLKPRFNLDAPDSAVIPGHLPESVDVRQMALIAAAWTLASVRRLGEAGAASATYYETVGWGGLIEADPLPVRDAPFPSVPGMLFPIYHVLAEVAPLSGNAMLECQSSNPLAVEAMQVAVAGSRTLLMSNLTPRAQRVLVESFGSGAKVRLLNLPTLRAHMLDAADLRQQWKPLSEYGSVGLELSPFEVTVIRWS